MNIKWAWDVRKQDNNKKEDQNKQLGKLTRQERENLVRQWWKV